MSLFKKYLMYPVIVSITFVTVALGISAVVAGLLWGLIELGS